MKNLCTNLAFVCIGLISQVSFGQVGNPPINEPDYNRPLLFSHLPERIPVSKTTLHNMLSQEVGQARSLTVSSDSLFQLDAEVVSVSAENDQKWQSVVMRTNNFPGATLTITKIQDEEGKEQLIGRVISFKHGDILELRQENGNYYFIKRKFYDLINE